MYYNWVPVWCTLTFVQKDCIVVPSAANMYIQVVQSDFIRRWSQLLPITVPGAEAIEPPPDLVRCHAASTVHDLQLDQIPQDQFTSLADPVRVFR